MNLMYFHVGHMNDDVMVAILIMFNGVKSANRNQDCHEDIHHARLSLLTVVFVHEFHFFLFEANFGHERLLDEKQGTCPFERRRNQDKRLIM